MASVKRSKRLLDEYDPHIAHFIRAKLAVPKSKDLDKAGGGKVIATELLKAVIESDDLRDRAIKLRPLVSSTFTELQAETIWDDYYLPETVDRKPRHGAPKGSKNTCCSVWSRFHMYVEELNSVQNDTKYLGKIYVFLDQDDGEVPLLGLQQRRMGNQQRKLLTLKETEPLVREVVQGIPTATAALKKKVRKRGRTVNATLPAHDSGREKSNSVGANERSLACVGYAYTMDNENRKVVELSKKLRVTKDRAIAIEGQVTALKEKVVSLETAQKKASDLEESSRDALEKQVVVDDDLRDRVKVLKKKVTSLKDQALLDVTYYNGLCFNAIYTAWDANAYLKETDFTIYGRKPVVGETLRVEGYNPKCSNFPPSVGDAPPRESEGRKETLVDVIGL
uniref:Uncharacterized protein n=1 Tax=Cannabis sativa TaxID=3483 RepID=A0A803P5Z1_CANSA